MLLELNDVPIKEELSKAIMEISSGRTPGQDGIPAEVFKCGRGQLLDALHQPLCRCLEEVYLAQKMIDEKCRVSRLLYDLYSFLYT